MARVQVQFSGVVIDVTVALCGTPVTLSRNAAGDKWTGWANVESGKDGEVDMIIIAPRFTDWALVVKVVATKLVEDEGTTDKDPYFKTWPVTIPRVANG